MEANTNKKERKYSQNTNIAEKLNQQWRMLCRVKIGCNYKLHLNTGFTVGIRVQMLSMAIRKPTQNKKENCDFKNKMN